MSGYVYFISWGAQGPIKIGHALDVYKRLDTLQTSTWMDLYVVAMTPGSLKDEKKLHRKFKQSLIRGEWFRRTPKLMTWVETIYLEHRMKEFALPAIRDRVKLRLETPQYLWSVIQNTRATA